MKIEEIKASEFNEFAKTHILKNFYQTAEYGELMSHSDFSVMYVGGYHDNNLVAASLILYKSIGPNMKYGYAPRGFLVDYYNTPLLKAFTKKLKDFFFLRGFAFIKINPEVTYATINFDVQSKTVSSKNKELIEVLKELGYDKLRDNLYFESLLPKFTPVIYLPNYRLDNLDEKLVEEMKTSELKGVRLVSGKEEDIPTFYKFVEHKNSKTETYYKYFLKTFSKSNMVDLLLLELKYETYVKFLQKQYIFEQENNEAINYEFNKDTTNMDLYNAKLESDKLMNKISADIALANERMQENQMSEILGGALIVKHEGRITIEITGQNADFVGIDIKTYLYYKIIEEYKKAGYLFLDMNGITADFTDKNPYKSLNDFKLKFKPTTYEYIGEFDLIVNKPFHQLLWSTNKIQKEFYKPAIK